MSKLHEVVRRQASIQAVLHPGRPMIGNVLPASRLPKVIEAWEAPHHEEFAPRTAWSLFNAFTEVAKTSPPRAQMEGSLRLSSLFRRELSLS